MKRKVSQGDKTGKEEKLAEHNRVKRALLFFSAKPCGAICTAGNGSVIPLFTGIGLTRLLPWQPGDTAPGPLTFTLQIDPLLDGPTGTDR